MDSGRRIYEGFSRANFSNSSLAELDLSNLNLEGSNFSGSDLTRSTLAYANLAACRFVGADLRGANLQGADLGRAVLNGADLRGAILDATDLRQADFEGADLRGASLEGANLQDAYLEGADLRGASLEDANLRGTLLAEVELDGGSISGSTKCKIRLDDFDGPDLGGSRVSSLVNDFPTLLRSSAGFSSRHPQRAARILLACAVFLLGLAAATATLDTFPRGREFATLISAAAGLLATIAAVKLSGPTGVGSRRD